MTGNETKDEHFAALSAGFASQQKLNQGFVAG
jgi:hypothetical protein